MSETSQAPRRHLDDDQLLDLSHGLLEDEQESRLSHLKSCPECEQRFRVIDGDREYQRARIAACVEESNRPPARRSRTLLAAGFVVIGLALSGAVLLVSRDGSPEGSAFWLPVDAETLQFRVDESGAGIGGAEWAAALEAYERREIDEALRMLQDARVPPEYEDVRSLFLAHVLVLSGRADEGLETLDALDVPTLPPPWRARAERIESLAHTAQDQK